MKTKRNESLYQIVRRWRTCAANPARYYSRMNAQKVKASRVVKASNASTRKQSPIACRLAAKRWMSAHKRRTGHAWGKKG
jgi:hypothetical protein